MSWSVMFARVLLGTLAILWPLPAFAELVSPEDLQAFRRPAVVPFPQNAPYDREIATLGKMLFFDPRLSAEQNMSCATCHNPSFGWEAPVARAVGTKNTPLSRHTPTILNSAWSDRFFWDGRARSLETQAKAPILTPEEMNSSFAVIEARLNQVEEYHEHFNRLFPQEGIRKRTILLALATFERTVVTKLAPFDYWVEGDTNAISESAKNGFSLFVGKAGCSGCHATWRFSSNGFFNVGSQDRMFSRYVPPPPETSKPLFKVPTLRNISLRAPYMHLGNLRDLQEVVNHYAQVSDTDPTLDIAPFEATPQEISDIIAFLRTLTEEGTDVRAPVLPAN
ncbi:cytochrome-c peroxidase [Shimia sp.]|uniref:cytochrome-c peroxidase n=1 Tax=Shimia sp. TaxID=1954381 RepID=UPI003BAD9C07